MDLIVSILTILTMELVARKYWQGWVVGLVNQAVWFLLIYSRELWGLLPLAIWLTITYILALRRWRDEEC